MGTGRTPLAGSIAIGDDGRYVRLARPTRQCVCCKPDVQQLVLDWVLAGLGHRRIQQQLAEVGVVVAHSGVQNHVRKHCEQGTNYDVAAHGAPVDVLALELQFKASAQEALARSRQIADARGEHVSFLEDVVAVASERMRAFPEHVTIEMGLRASAELVKAKQSAERDELLKMLGATAGRTVASVEAAGVNTVARKVTHLLEAPGE